MVHPQSSFDTHSGHVFLLWFNHFRVYTGHVTRGSTHRIYEISLTDSGKHSNGAISSYVHSFHSRTELTSRQTSPAQHYSSTSPTSSHHANKDVTNSQVSINHWTHPPTEMLGDGNMLSTTHNPLEKHIGAGRGVMHGMKVVRREMSYAVRSRSATMRKGIGGELMIWFDRLYICILSIWREFLESTRHP